MSDLTESDLMRSKRGAAATSRSTEAAREQLRADAEEQIREINARDAREGRWAS